MTLSVKPSGTKVVGGATRACQRAVASPSEDGKFNFGDISGWIVPTAAILGWALTSLYRLYLVGRTREQAHRERMAMIERGVQPPPPESAALPLDRRGSTDPAARTAAPGSSSSVSV
jgi:hypothetical protein